MDYLWTKIKKFVNPLHLLISCLPLLISCQTQSPSPELTVKVERVISGQTLEIAGQPLVKVRLIGIEAPDLRQQPWGQAAKQYLTEILKEQPVLLELDREPEDNYGRKMAYVWCDRDLVNEKLVAQGYALAVPRSPNNKYNERLARAQEQARLLGLGIWDSKNPMRLTPSEFRAQNRS